jgi:hypothetical protein
MTHMSDRDPRIQELARKKVVYQIPGMDAAAVRRDQAYRTTGDGALLMDLYYPAETKSGERLPVVVIVMGYPDPQGFYRRMGWAVSWAQLIAACCIAYGRRIFPRLQFSSLQIPAFFLSFLPMHACVRAPARRF